jgi:hypothetical protein
MTIQGALAGNGAFAFSLTVLFALVGEIKEKSDRVLRRTAQNATPLRSGVNQRSGVRRSALAREKPTKRRRGTLP